MISSSQNNYLSLSNQIQRTRFLIDNIRELARFLGVPSTVTEEAAGLLEDIVKLCNIETLRASSAVGPSGEAKNHPLRAHRR